MFTGRTLEASERYANPILFLAGAAARGEAATSLPRYTDTPLPLRKHPFRTPSVESILQSPSVPTAPAPRRRPRHPSPACFTRPRALTLFGPPAFAVVTVLTRVALVLTRAWTLTPANAEVEAIRAAMLTR